MNYFKTFLLLAVFIFSSLNSHSQVTIESDDPLINYAGRINFTDTKAPKFAYSGVSIKAKFEGTQVSALLSSATNSNYFFIIVDDTIPYKINILSAQSEYLLANNLTDTEHTVEIFKLTEANQGTVTFSGLIIDNGKTLVALPAIPPRKIEYIGNSITCGYGNETLVPADGFSSDQENHYYTYAAYTSRNLDAQHMAVCYSGRGIYRNWDGPVTGNANNMPSIYDKTIHSEADVWDFNDYQPDVVCINLATNDFSTIGADTALYIDAYRVFLDRLRTYYPASKLVCLAGSMMSGDNLEILKNTLNYLVDEFNTGGDSEVYFFEMSPQTGEFGLGGDSHPTVEQHRYNGVELTQYLSDLMGWAIIPNLMDASVLNPGNKIEVAFNTKMKSPAGDVSNFTVLANSVEQTISSATLSIDSLSFILNLDTLLIEGDVVSVSYANGTVVSADDNLLANFYNVDAINELVATGILATSVNTAGNEIEIVFNKELLDPTTFADITISTSVSSGISISSYYFDVTFLERMVHLELSQPILKGEVVTITYTAATILGNDSVPLTAFTDNAVSNYSNNDGTSSSLENGDTFKVFPNPSNGNFNLYLSNNSEIQISLFNTAGQMLFTKNINNNYSFGNELPVGFYILKLNSEAGEKVFDLVKR